MKFMSILLTAVCFFSIIGCNKNSSDPNSGFTNKLTLGSGMSGFNLVKEGTSFTRVGLNATIFFRLESATDMAGSGLNITIEKDSLGTWKSYLTFPYTNTQSYGHIFLSSFLIPQAGSFRATGILLTGNKTVASTNFTVQ